MKTFPEPLMHSKILALNPLLFVSKPFRVIMKRFFVVAVISRLLPRSWRPLGVGHASESCLQEARRTAHTVIPYAFMR